MRIGIIGANGKQGAMLCNEAKKRGHIVTAYVRKKKNETPCVDKIVEKDLFELTCDDVKELDVLISSFGSGFDCDPEINRRAINKAACLALQNGIRVMFVGGAGALYTDQTKAKRVYQTEGYPDFLFGISKNMTLGYEDIKNTAGLNWTYVCPSLEFIYDAPPTGKYILGSDTVTYSSDGKSEIGYADFAKAFIDEVENPQHMREIITVCRP